MKIIFLDIDGCLVTARSMRIARELGRPVGSSKGNECFDGECVDVLNKLIKVTGAKVVISSTWRLGETVSSMQDILNRNKVKCKVVGLTGRDTHRGKEILTWLKEYNHNNIEYVVIDDDEFDIKEFIPKDQFVHIKNGLMGYGLQEEHLKQGLVAQWLGR